MEAKEIILALALKYSNDWQLIYEGIKTKEDLTEEDLQRVADFKGNYITVLDKEYPQRLKSMYHLPFVLFYEGDLSLLSKVDENGKNNKLVYLHGPNTLKIPEDRLCVALPNNVYLISGGLKVWTDKRRGIMDTCHLPSGLCHNIVCTKIYRREESSPFIALTLSSSLSMGNNIFMVPTSTPSLNNALIKQGAYLIDEISDLDVEEE